MDLMRSLGFLFAVIPVALVPALLLINQHTVWPAIITYHAYCVAVPLTCRRISPHDSETPRPWLSPTLLVTALLIAVGELGPWASVQHWLPTAWLRVVGTASPWWIFVTYSLLVNAACEEFFWRGFILPVTRIGLGGVLLWAMHVAAASVFVDVFSALWLTLPVLIAGLGWGWMRTHYKTLWPCIATHVAADLALLRIAARLTEP
jgi:membrane protease YdiL (CAAX protease family)